MLIQLIKIDDLPIQYHIAGRDKVSDKEMWR